VSLGKLAELMAWRTDKNRGAAPLDPMAPRGRRLGQGGEPFLQWTRCQDVWRNGGGGLEVLLSN
jgi:hypothetical protein